VIVIIGPRIIISKPKVTPTPIATYFYFDDWTFSIMVLSGI